MRRATILILGGGPYQLPLIQAAVGLGLDVAVADRHADAPGLALAHHPMPVDFSCTDAVVAHARALGPVAVLTAGSDVAQHAAVEVARALGLPALPRDTLACCQDKAAMATRLTARGVPTPRSVSVSTVAQALRAAPEVAVDAPWPVVVKPTAGAGGRGVTMVESEAQMAEALPRATRYGQGALVQTWVGGRAVGVEMLMVEGEPAGLWMFDDQLRPGFAAPVGHSMPSTLGAEARAEVARVAVEAARAVGLRSGPANLDMRWVASIGQAVVLEINPRMGGSDIAGLIHSATGARLAEGVVAWAVGADPLSHLGARHERGAATRLLLIRGAGRLRIAQADPPPHGAPEGVYVALDVRDGQPAPQQVDDWSLVGRLSTVAEDGASAERLAAEAAAIIEARVTVEQTGT